LEHPVGLDNPLHIAFLLVILLLVFGAKRLPEMGRSLGSGLRGFKESISGDAQPEHAEQLTMAAEPTPEQADAPRVTTAA
jgi:sec-independent protein translocase protein TatA